MFVLYVIWGRRSFIDPICCNFCMVLSMFLRLVLANPSFFLQDINLTLGLSPPKLSQRQFASVREEDIVDRECHREWHGGRVPGSI